MNAAILLLLAAACSAALAAPASDTRTLTDEEKVFKEQAENAHYNFESHVTDHIKDQSQDRTERRDGLRTEGSFAYSDGFLKRTVNYEADEQGFRVLSDNVEPLAGPKEDPEGVASVRTLFNGDEFEYQVRSQKVE